MCKSLQPAEIVSSRFSGRPHLEKQRWRVIGKDSPSDHHTLTDRCSHICAPPTHWCPKVFYFNLSTIKLFWTDLWRGVWYDFLVLDTWFSQDYCLSIAWFCLFLDRSYCADLAGFKLIDLPASWMLRSNICSSRPSSIAGFCLLIFVLGTRSHVTSDDLMLQIVEVCCLILIYASLMTDKHHQFWFCAVWGSNSGLCSCQACTQLSYMLLPSLKSVTICVKVLVNADLVALSFCLIIFSTAFAMLIWLLYL